MNRIIGNPTATPMKVPDWNQNDERKADYIKNRPLKEIQAMKSLQYYGDANIVPSDANLFEFYTYGRDTCVTKNQNKPISGDIVIPYECVIDGEKYSVTYFPDFGFSNLTEITSIAIPDGITFISQGMFAEDKNLKSITIPDSITTIEYYAFLNCTSLTDIYFRGTKEQWDAISIGDGNEALLNANIHFEWSEEAVNKDECKGYYFSGIDFANEKIYLCKDQTVPVKITNENRNAFKEQWGLDKDLVDTNFDTPPYDLSLVGTKDTGLYFSINNYTDYHDFCGTIVDISHNVVTYKGDYGDKSGKLCELPFENTGVDKYGNVVDKEKLDVNDYVFYVPTQPEIGLVKFSEGGISNGEGAIAPGDGAIASGGDVVAGGRFSGAIGRFLKAAYTAFAINQTNKARGANAFAGGNDSVTDAKTSFVFGLSCFIHRLAEYSAVIGNYAKAFAKYVFVIGRGTEAHSPDQFVGGTYNAYKDQNGNLIDALAIFGNGTSDSERSNAHILDREGNAWYAGNVTVGANNEKLAKVSELKAIAPKIVDFADSPFEELSITLENNVLFNSGIISVAFDVSFPNDLSIGYISAFYFITPNEIPTNYSTFFEDVVFKGDSVEDERFVPEANMRYTIVFDYDGVNVIGYVSGVSV